MPTTVRRIRTLLTLAIVAAGLTLVAPTPASAAGTTITFTGPSKAPVTYDDIFMSGQVSPAGATSRTVLQIETPAGWHDLGGWRPGADGSVEIPYFTKARGLHRLRLRSLHGSVVSNVIELQVAPHPTEIRAYGVAGTRPIVVGQRLFVEGYVIEPTATPRVVVQRKVNGKWSDRAAGPVNAKGEFSVAIAPSQTGRYELRVRSNGGSTWSQYPLIFDVQPKPVP